MIVRSPRIGSPACVQLLHHVVTVGIAAAPDLPASAQPRYPPTRLVSPNRFQNSAFIVPLRPTCRCDTSPERVNIFTIRIGHALEERPAMSPDRATGDPSLQLEDQSSSPRVASGDQGLNTGRSSDEPEMAWSNCSIDDHCQPCLSACRRHTKLVGDRGVALIVGRIAGVERPSLHVLSASGGALP